MRETSLLTHSSRIQLVSDEMCQIRSPTHSSRVRPVRDEMHQTCHKYEWVMSHIRLSHVPQISESCPTYECIRRVCWRIYFAFISLAMKYVNPFILRSFRMWDMTHLSVGHDSIVCGTWLIHICDMSDEIRQPIYLAFVSCVMKYVRSRGCEMNVSAIW